MGNIVDFFTSTTQQTFDLAKKLASIIRSPGCIALDGPLGAGKTQFAKGFANGCGITDEVTSPTFSLMNEYDGDVELLHIDFYRLAEEDLQELGMEEQIEDWQGVVLIEWASLHPSILPIDFIQVSIKILSESRRSFSIKTIGNASFSSEELDEYK